ncbi:MAG: bifunctional diguanylate cyclase/phosphodiesterase, partial [Dehalococcoidia bacterium]|nr:bifunctional diguanylate cyclase/phosphodiesterase [Dehalococcoidia bacterium]
MKWRGTPSEGKWRPRWSPRLAARAAAGAITLVLLGLAVYSITMDRRSSDSAVDAERAILVARSYAEIASMVDGLERDASSFIFEPTVERRDTFNRNVDLVMRRMDEVAQEGGSRDLALIDYLQRQYLPQLRGVQDFFDHVLAGEPYYGEIANQDTLAQLRAALEDPVRRRQEASLAAMQELRRSQQQRVLTTAGVFAGGIGLVVLLLLVQRHSANQIASAEAALVQLRRETTTDSLTGLGNHRAFQEALRRDSTNDAGALVMVDLDRFKEANDLRGHAEGDQILRAVGELLATIFPRRAYRIGGDEFAAFAPTYEEATTSAERLVLTLRERIPGITASAGVTGWDGDTPTCPSRATQHESGFDANLVSAQADAALRWAKREGRNHWVGYPDIADRVGGVASAKKSQAVRRLIQQETGVSTVFQPIWGLDGRLRAAEALSRFDPELGLGGPEEAFDIANQDGRSLELDRLCFETTIRNARALPNGVTLFINVSPSALIDQRFETARLVATARRHYRAPSSIVLEVTERADVPIDVLEERIRSLRDAGFGIALDDVGAGNAGLET